MNNTMRNDDPDMDYPLLFSGLPAMRSDNETELVRFCELHQRYVLASMPWAASEIAGVYGFATLFHLMYRHGGRKIYMPKDATRFGQLYGVNITEFDYQKLAKRADTSGHIELPSAWGVFIAIRRAAMQMAMRENVPSQELTRTFGVSMRNIRMIRSSSGKIKGGEAV